MATTIEELVLRLTADNAELRRELNTARRDVSTAARAMERSFSDVDKSIVSVGRAVKGLIFGRVAQEIIQTTRAALDFADAIGDTAQGLGVTTDFLQEMRAAAKTVGVESNQLEVSLTKLGRKAVDALGGNTKAAKSFDLLGISMVQVRNTGGDVEQLLDLVADGMKRTESETVRNAAATELLGKGAFRLVPALQGGSEALATMRAGAHETGQVMRADLIERFGEVSDRVDALSEGLKVQLYEAFVALGPAIEGTLELLVRLADRLDGVADAARGIAFKFGGDVELSGISKEELTERLRSLKEIEKTRAEAATSWTAFAKSKLIFTDQGDTLSPEGVAADKARIEAELVRREFVGPQISPSLLALRQGRAGARAGFSGIEDEGAEKRARSAEKEAERRAKAAEAAARKVEDFEAELTKSALTASDQRIAAIFAEHEQRETQIVRIARSEEEAARLRVALEADTGAKIAAEIEKVGDARQKQLERGLDLEEQLLRRIAQAEGDTAGLKALDRAAGVREITALGLPKDRENELVALLDRSIEAGATSGFDKLIDIGSDAFAELLVDFAEGAEITWAQVGKSLAISLLRAEAAAFAGGLFGGLGGKKQAEGDSGLFGGAAGSLLGGLIKSILPFDEGGYITQPTLGLLHPREAVIPLDRFEAMIGTRGGTVVNIHNYSAEPVTQKTRQSGGEEILDVMVGRSIRRQLGAGAMKDEFGRRHAPGVS